ncbi:MAG: hypothetical protein ACT4O2_09400 [Beijerinckiaceae bacterium]
MRSSKRPPFQWNAGRKKLRGRKRQDRLRTRCGPIMELLEPRLLVNSPFALSLTGELDLLFGWLEPSAADEVKSWRKKLQGSEPDGWEELYANLV